MRFLTPLFALILVTDYLCGKLVISQSCYWRNTLIYNWLNNWQQQLHTNCLSFLLHHLVAIVKSLIAPSVVAVVKSLMTNVDTFHEWHTCCIQHLLRIKRSNNTKRKYILHKMKSRYIHKFSVDKFKHHQLRHLESGREKFGSGHQKKNI